MTPEKQEWNGEERRKARQRPEPWRIIEPDGSECPIRFTTVPPEHYEEVMSRLMSRRVRAQR